MKIVYTILILILVSFFNTGSFAETKTDCSQYNTKTLVGSWNKKRCERIFG